MLDTEYILTLGVFLSLLLQVKETCHKIYGFLEFVLSSSKWETAVEPILTNSTAPLSEFSQVTELRKKVLPYAIALGRWAVGIFQQTTGGRWHCLHCPGVTWFDILLLSYLDDILICPLYPPCREPRATKSLVLYPALATSWQGEEALTIRISCTSSE